MLDHEGYHHRTLALQCALSLPGHSETSRAALEIAMQTPTGHAAQFLRDVSEAARLSGEITGGAGAEALRRAAALVEWRDSDQTHRNNVLALIS